MNPIGRIEKTAARLITFFKPFIIVLVVLIFLRVTGLTSYVSSAGTWVILETGLRDAGPDDSVGRARPDDSVGRAASEKDATEEDFDFDFSIQDLQGNKIPFEQFRGKVIFLNLWATWCGPCRAEMAGIENLYTKTDKSRIEFVMLSIDRDSDKNKVISYMQSKKFSFQGFMPSGYLPKQLKVPEIPTTFIISKDGKIVRKEVGSMRYDTPKFQKFLEGLSQ
jgi:thiol-disulfide isomerase/thioredoxin